MNILNIFKRIKELEGFKNKAEKTIYCGENYPYTSVTKTRALDELPEIVEKLTDRVKKLEGICMYEKDTATTFIDSVTVGVKVYTIDKDIRDIHQKLNMLIDHLGLEEHKPDCTTKFRKKK